MKFEPPPYIGVCRVGGEDIEGYWYSEKDMQEALQRAEYAWKNTRMIDKQRIELQEEIRKLKDLLITTGITDEQ